MVAEVHLRSLISITTKKIYQFSWEISSESEVSSLSEPSSNPEEDFLDSEDEDIEAVYSLKTPYQDEPLAERVEVEVKGKGDSLGKGHSASTEIML